MLRNRVWTLFLSIMILWPVGQTEAASLSLLWNYDRTFVPAPQSFVLTVTQAGATPQHFKVAPAGVGACTKLDPASVDAFCTQLACPQPGTVAAFWVEGVWSEQTSAPSNIATCWFKPGDVGCPCHDPTEATAPPPVASPPPPTPPGLPTPRTPPVLSTTVPPLPQHSAVGLNLQPIGPLPPIPSVPAAPSAAAT